MKEEAAHTLARVNICDFFKKSRYKQPIITVLAINLGSQLSGFNAVRLLSVVFVKTFLFLPQLKKNNFFFQVINYSTRMFQAKFNEAKYLTLGVGAANVAFTLVAVSGTDS